MILTTTLVYHDPSTVINYDVRIAENRTESFWPFWVYFEVFLNPCIYIIESVPPSVRRRQSAFYIIKSGNWGHRLLCLIRRYSGNPKISWQSKEWLWSKQTVVIQRSNDPGCSCDTRMRK